MIVLFTDFGSGSPYVGQMHNVLAQRAPGVPVIDLLHDVPPWSVQAGAYLLPAYINEFPESTVFCCVVDPGVGGPRRCLAMHADHYWLLAPDNGLLSIVARRAKLVRTFELAVPGHASASFHGRDVFAPTAARLTQGRGLSLPPAKMAIPDWPEDLARVLYVDAFGNGITGLRAEQLADGAGIQVGDRTLGQVRTFGEKPAGEAFWFANANGLVEIAVNRGSAAREMKLVPGSRVQVV
ncbi:MAG: SAM-dependent chlorinase/fluorinase [Gammaproteobacteria bacterium]|jgi:hypothetical protein|nr:SAM-dependent chlorinase/fluorinase [Gammaproteobacteria bacterium]